MGSTVNPRARGGSRGAIGDELRASRKDREQIRRLHRSTEKPKPAASGGVAGVTRLTAGGMAQANAASPTGSSVRFSGYSVASLFGDGPSVAEGSDGRIVLGAAGFYECRAYVRVGWSSSATVDQVQVSADFAGADPYPFWIQRLGTNDGHGGGGPTLRGVFSWGPFYVDAGGWTYFGLDWQSTDVAFLSSMALDVWRVG